MTDHQIPQDYAAPRNPQQLTEHAKTILQTHIRL